MSDKNQAIIEYLSDCPYIRDNPLFFNFGNAKDNNAQIVVQSDDISMNRKFVDGSELRRFTFNLLVYKSITYNPIVKNVPIVTTEPQPIYPNENVEELADVQGIIDWITTQNDLNNFPDFGASCTVDSIEALTTNPSMSGVNASVTPPLATYNISIRVVYLDTNKSIWNN